LDDRQMAVDVVSSPPLYQPPALQRRCRSVPGSSPAAIARTIQCLGPPDLCSVALSAPSGVSTRPGTERRGETLPRFGAS